MSNARDSVDKVRWSVSADNGDASATLSFGASDTVQLWKTPLTADRTVTLSTTNAPEGARFRIIRTLAATGLFSLNVGAGPLVQLQVGNEWCEVTFDGSAWSLSGYGVFYVAI